MVDLPVDLVACDAQTVARGLIETVVYPTLGPLQMLGVIPKLSLTPGRVTSPPPQLGQHNREVYGSLLGLCDAEIAELRGRRGHLSRRRSWTAVTPARCAPCRVR